MKILMLAPEPFFEPRGTPFSILYRLRALNDLGHSVDLLSYPIGDDLELLGVRHLRSPRVLGIRSVAIGPSLKKLLLDVGLYREARRLLSRGGYDVLHTHEEAALFGGSLARKYGVRHLYDMHSQLSKQLSYYPFFRFVLFRRLFERLERSTLRDADAVITISPSLQEIVRSIDPDGDPVLVENTLDGDDFGIWGENHRAPVPHELQSFEQNGKKVVDLRTTYGFPEDAVVVVYAGSFEPYQGLESLVEGASRVVESCPQVRFLLVGGQSREVDRLKRLGAAVGLEDHLRFAGRLDPRDVPSHLRGADVLVSPRREGSNIPSKIYSYLKAGQAIVATRSQAHTQVLDSDVAVLTDGTAAGLASALIEVTRDPALRSRLGSKALRVAGERCSYESYLEAIRLAYDRLGR